MSRVTVQWDRDSQYHINFTGGGRKGNVPNLQRYTPGVCSGIKFTPYRDRPNRELSSW